MKSKYHKYKQGVFSPQNRKKFLNPEGSPVKTIESFRESVVAALQGDDNTWTVDQVTASFYNAISVSNEFSKLGITTTSPCYEPRELEELSFLSSSFSRFIDHVCVYDLDTDKILESLKWTEYPNDPVRTLERVAACLLNTWPNSEARWLCRKLASVIIGEYDPILRGEKCWVDQKNKFWTDTMFLFFYVGDAGALNDISHIKDFEMESWITKNGGYALQKNKNRKRKEKRARKARPTNNKPPYRDWETAGLEEYDIEYIETLVPDFKFGKNNDIVDDINELKNDLNSGKDYVKNLKNSIKGDISNTTHRASYIVITFPTYDEKADFLSGIGVNEDDIYITSDKFFKRLNE